VPCHPNLEEYLDAWIAGAGITRDKKGPLFRSMGKGDRLGERAPSRFDVLHMIKRRAEAAALPYSTCCHTFSRYVVVIKEFRGHRKSRRSPRL
jgi:hypothetical protein